MKTTTERQPSVWSRSDAVKDEVVARLQRLSLTQLEEVAGTLTVDVPAEKKQKLKEDDI